MDMHVWQALALLWSPLPLYCLTPRACTPLKGRCVQHSAGVEAIGIGDKTGDVVAYIRIDVHIEKRFI